MSNFFKIPVTEKWKGREEMCKSTKYCVHKAEFTMEIGVSEQIYRVQMGWLLNKAFHWSVYLGILTL